MTRLEKAYNDIHNDGIAVNNYHFSRTKKAACMKYGGYETIILDYDAIRDSAEELSLVAEEHAHYETGALYVVDATYNMPTARINRIIAEAQAQRHAIEKHIPFDELKLAFGNFVYADGLDIYQLAEHFEVTPGFVQKAIEYYHQKGCCW